MIGEIYVDVADVDGPSPLMSAFECRRQDWGGPAHSVLARRANHGCHWFANRILVSNHLLPFVRLCDFRPSASFS